MKRTLLKFSALKFFIIGLMGYLVYQNTLPHWFVAFWLILNLVFVLLSFLNPYSFLKSEKTKQFEFFLIFFLAALTTFEIPAIFVECLSILFSYLYALQFSKYISKYPWKNILYAAQEPTLT
jgi:hypothetical protein